MASCKNDFLCTLIKLLGQLFIFEKKEKKLEKTRQNMPKKTGDLREKNRRALLCLFRARLVNRPISCSPSKSPTKEPGIKKALRVTPALRLDSGQLCYGRHFRAWLWTARFWDQKVGYCYTNCFLFHFRVFPNFLSKLGLFKSAICFLTALKERGYPMLNARERWDVKDMFLDLISQMLIFHLVLCESVLFNEGFSTEILFQAISRTLNRSIRLAFVPFSQFYAKVLSTKPRPG